MSPSSQVDNPRSFLRVGGAEITEMSLESGVEKPLPSLRMRTCIVRVASVDRGLGWARKGGLPRHVLGPKTLNPTLTSKNGPCIRPFLDELTFFIIIRSPVGAIWRLVTVLDAAFRSSVILTVPSGSTCDHVVCLLLALTSPNVPSWLAFALKVLRICLKFISLQV